MTPTTPSTSPRSSLPALSLRSPDALVAAIPYLLGFRPCESAVIVWLDGGGILLTQRLDLPTDAEQYAGWLRAVWGHAAADRAEELVIVLVTSREPDPVLVARVLDSASDRGAAVRDVLLVTDDRWRSLMCRDEACCPAGGRTLDATVAAAVAAEFTVLGRAPLPDRASVGDAMAPDPMMAARVAAVGQCGPPASRRDPDPRREEWREVALGLIADFLGGSDVAASYADLDPAVAARMLAGLADIRVRDTVLWDLAQVDAESLARAADRLMWLVRVAPEGLAAPIASCCAVAAWLSGDGVRALMAVDRAHADDPGYSLAGLVGASVEVGLPPQSWRDAMAGLTRDDCRYGVRG